MNNISGTFRMGVPFIDSRSKKVATAIGNFIYFRLEAPVEAQVWTVAGTVLEDRLAVGADR